MASHEPPIDPSDSDAETPVCPKCFGENTSLASRCVHCGAFFSGRAASLPFESSLAGAWAIGETSSVRRPSLVLLIGAWLLIFPTLGAAILFLARGGRWGSSDSFEIVEVVAAALWASLFGYVLYRTTQNFIRGRRATVSTDDQAQPDEPTEPRP